MGTRFCRFLTTTLNRPCRFGSPPPYSRTLTDSLPYIADRTDCYPTSRALRTRSNLTDWAVPSPTPYRSYNGLTGGGPAPLIPTSYHGGGATCPPRHPRQGYAVNPDPKRPHVGLACKAAGRPHGRDTETGQRFRVGHNVSLGQRERILLTYLQVTQRKRGVPFAGTWLLPCYRSVCACYVAVSSGLNHAQKHLS